MRGSVRTYWVHTLWTGNVFLLLFVLLSPVIAFLLSVLLLPDSLEIGGDLKRRFYQNSHWFFALAALFPPIDALDTLLKGAAHFQAQGPIYVVTIACCLCCSLPSISGCWRRPDGLVDSRWRIQGEGFYEL